MKGLKFLRKPKEKKEGRVVFLEGLRGRDKKLHETLVSSSLLSPGPPSKIISLEKALQDAKNCEEKGMEKQQAVACWLIATRRALFNGGQEALEECLEKYETLTGKRLLEKEEVDRAIKLVQEYYPEYYPRVG